MPGTAAADPPYPASTGQVPGRAGRPRDPRVDEAVRAAALDLLVDEGYQATSIQAIARRAGVSAPSIYRRWSSKAELIEAAVFPDVLLEPDPSGDVDEQLRSYCRTILDYLGDPAVRAAIPGLLTEYRSDPAMWRRLAQRSIAPMRAAFADFLARSGRTTIGSPEALFEVLLGALFVRAINYGADGADEFAGEVARVISAALTAPSRRPRRRAVRR
jgi:AcrR family transcriptional regulator